MIAKIIPFPMRGRARSVHASKKRDELATPLRDSHATADRSEIATPMHWTPYDDHIYETLVRWGVSAHEAASKIERDIASRNRPDDGSDRLLLQAREALRSAKELKR